MPKAAQELARPFSFLAWSGEEQTIRQILPVTLLHQRAHLFSKPDRDRIGLHHIGPDFFYRGSALQKGHPVLVRFWSDFRKQEAFESEQDQ